MLKTFCGQTTSVPTFTTGNRSGRALNRPFMNRYDLTAVIYDKRDRILSIGKNSYVKTHPMQAEYARKVGKENNIFLHAEMHAIAKCRDLKRAYRIVVMRFNREGEPRSAKPCPICMEALNHVGIRIIEHT
jgi:tRNA(Arg) A34 adenosine deaminase TadA